MRVDRRRFLRAAAGAATSPWWLACATWGEARPAAQPFLHGVASGDPTSDSVVLWTRVTPEAGSVGAMPVVWEIADDPDFASPRARGEAVATPDCDYTVKVDVAGLAAGRRYAYRFRVGSRLSPVGRTRTLPDGTPERLRLAFASCSAFEAGTFAAYARLAERDDLDLVLHLGDYVYEYADGVVGNGAALGRAPEPPRECTTLGDYRTRHAQYRRDPDLQALHRAHPVVVAWDDHEVANNAWREGAQNHQPEEGPWAARRAAATRAFREWLPVREPFADGAACYRGFRVGDLADLAILDTRTHRDVQLPAETPAAEHAASARSLLGRAQEQWLADRAVASQRDGVAWRVIGQQVVFAPMRDPQGRVRNPDAWEGYAATRERLYDLWEERALVDNVILTGDVHSSWALDAPRDPFAASGGGPIHAVEFVTPGITSRTHVPPEHRREVEATVLAENPHLHWVEFGGRGFAILDLDRERARCEWFHVETVARRDAPARRVAAFEAPRGQGLRAAPDDPPPGGMHGSRRRG